MNTHRGFTLIELMIVLVIVAILSAIALPSYNAQMIKTRRAEAQSCLLEIAQYLEREYTKSLNISALTLPGLTCRNGDQIYSFSFPAPVPPATANPGTKTYTIQAAPQGKQTADNTACGTLTLDEKGVKTASGSDPNCWK